jgi:hypothetical protein
MVAPKGELSKAAEGACSFQVAIAMPLIRAAIMNNPHMDGMQKAQTYAMQQDSIQHMLRPGEVTNQCRRIDDLAKVGMPKNAKGYLPCGFPKYIICRFRSWKTNRQGSENDYYTYDMKMFHNSTNIDMDAVTAITHYIAVSGLDFNTPGPMVSIYSCIHIKWNDAFLHIKWNDAITIKN